jgi:hypothetical protein
MADKSLIPARVRHLIADQIQTAGHLVVLLLLFRNPDRWWSAESVAEELRISSLTAASRLEDLASRMLLDARVAETVMFRYKPVSTALHATVGDLARLYAELTSEVMTLIRDRATEQIRGFADAFRIRREDDDG